MLRSDAVDDHLWVRRTAILAQLKHREETDLELLADVIDANLEGSRFGREFFIRKAIGWALRQHARVDPQWVHSLRRRRAVTGCRASPGARPSSTSDPEQRDAARRGGGPAAPGRGVTYGVVVVVIAAPTRR